MMIRTFMDKEIRYFCNAVINQIRTRMIRSPIFIFYFINTYFNHILKIELSFINAKLNNDI